jgi:excisionase family DNA binding protein
MDSRYVTRKEASSLLGISTRTLDRMIKQGTLRRHRRVEGAAFGGRPVFLLRSDVERLASPGDDGGPQDAGLMGAGAGADRTEDTEE